MLPDSNTGPWRVNICRLWLTTAFLFCMVLWQYMKIRILNIYKQPTNALTFSSLLFCSAAPTCFDTCVSSSGSFSVLAELHANPERLRWSSGLHAGLWFPRSRVRTRKIHRTPSFGGEVKPSVPCRRFAACKKTPAIYVEVGIAGKIDRPFLAQFIP
jgi:hypothetical protein